MKLWRDRTLRARVKLGALLAFLLLVALAADSKKEDCCSNPEDGQKEPKFYHYYVTAGPSVVYLTVGGSAPVTVIATCEGEPGCITPALPLKLKYPPGISVTGSLNSASTTLTISAPLPSSKSQSGNLVSEGVGNWYRVLLGVTNAPGLYAAVDAAIVDVWVQTGQGPPPPPPKPNTVEGPVLYLADMIKASMGVHFGTVPVGSSTDAWISVINAGGKDLIITSVTLKKEIGPTKGDFSLLAQPPFILGMTSSLKLPVRFTAKSLTVIGKDGGTNPADTTGNCVTGVTFGSNAETLVPREGVVYLRANVGAATPTGLDSAPPPPEARREVP